jgi:sortase B
MIGGRNQPPDIIGENMKKKKITIIIIILLFVTAAICGFFFFKEYFTAQDEIAEYTRIQTTYATTYSPTALNNEHTPDPEQSETAHLPYVVVDFDALLAENPNTVGWIAIPDTLVNYPVVQARDNQKYLKTSFSGARAGAGAIFMDCYNSADPLSHNTILYGHNMGSGRTDMFGTLLDYKDYEHYKAHPYIQFDTIYEQHGWWKIFAVIHLNTQTDNFDYLRLWFEDDAQAESWIKQAKSMSLYDTGVTARANDKILTLSTCDRSDGYGRNGRLIILAVKMED